MTTGAQTQTPTEQAISKIVKHRTSPLYIRKWDLECTEAEDYLETLSPQESKAATAEVEKQIDAYHTTIEGMNGNSHYDMDQAMMYN